MPQTPSNPENSFASITTHSAPAEDAPSQMASAIALVLPLVLSYTTATFIMTPAGNRSVQQKRIEMGFSTLKEPLLRPHPLTKN